MVDDEKRKEKWAQWKVPEVDDAPDDDLSEPVQFLNIGDLQPGDKAGDQPVIMPPIKRARPSVIINSDVHGGGGTKVREMPVVVEAERGPISVVEKRKKEILAHLEADTPESRKKIAEVVLFNLRGTRTNRQLPTKDFGSVVELEDAIRSLPILEGEEDFTVMVGVDRQGVFSSESVRPSKIVSVPLSGLKIAGRSAEINLDIKFVPGAFEDGKFAVVGVKASFDDQIGAGVGEDTPSSKPSFLEKWFGIKPKK